MSGVNKGDKVLTKRERERERERERDESLLFAIGNIY